MPPRSPESIQMPPTQEAQEALRQQQVLVVAEQAGPLAVDAAVAKTPQSPEVLEREQRIVADAPAVGSVSVEGTYGKIKSYLKDKFTGDQGGVLPLPGKQLESEQNSDTNTAQMLKVSASTYKLAQMSSQINWAKYSVPNEQEQPWNHDTWKKQNNSTDAWKPQASASFPNDYIDPVSVGAKLKEQIGSGVESELHVSDAAPQEKWWIPAPETTIHVAPVIETGNFVTVDEAQVLSAESSVTPDQVVELMERQRVVKTVSSLKEIIADDSRTNRLRFINTTSASMGKPASESDTVRENTEQQAAAELMTFLQHVRTVAEQYPAATENLKKLALRAQDMAENLTFIGEKERNEAAKGIADYWKAWLREDPNRQLCTLTGISGVGEVKSDKFLMNSILGNFTDEELEEFQGRFVSDMDSLNAEPSNTKIVMVDDWTISGTQMTSQYHKIKGDPNFAKYVDSLEMQLVTSEKTRIEDGLKIVDFNNTVEARVPIRSYFLSRRATIKSLLWEDAGHEAYESGSHSSVDYDFELDYIQPMLAELRQVYSPEDIAQYEMLQRMPALTNVERVYKRPDFSESDLVNIERRKAISSRNTQTQRQMPVGAF